MRKIRAFFLMIWAVIMLAIDWVDSQIDRVKRGPEESPDDSAAPEGAWEPRTASYPGEAYHEEDQT